MEKRKRQNRETWVEPREAMKKTLWLMSQVHFFTERHLRDHLRKEFPDEVEEFMEWVKNYWIQIGIKEGRRIVAQEYVLGWLSQKDGDVALPQQDVIRNLSLSQLEQLARDLWGFSTATNLDMWLKANPIQEEKGDEGLSFS